MSTIFRRTPTITPQITPEYLNYNEGPKFVAIVATLVSVALLIFLLRVYTRARILHFFGFDDWFMLIAALCASGLLIIFIALTRLGFGKHTSAIPLDDLGRISKWLWWFSLVYIMGVSFVKLSIACCLLRIIQRPNYRRFLYGMLEVLLAVLTLAWFFTFIFQCVPVAAAWHSSLRPPHITEGNARCMSHTTYRDLGLFNSAINIATDVIFATLPIPIIWNLRVNLRTRISLIVILGLGFLACAASLVRMLMIYHIWEHPDPFA
ncbi:uncharacterized protein BDR25DRAFT_223412 [Lindgomyces ingoldianus]|uniref:Uncharacterized protein n=1 Tax=Lindgomyces ingoldianus TaxID=673940 RepID=A0ACB6QWE1_9PLEO|nr:uncharacterized protein BDR25DRAFT_223412 [Lindgomyces ingoldianus]KAF2471195.1 hypothetical protein BDR25DRAFT_223412 [Lindgomyces ingoldianus]